VATRYLFTARTLDGHDLTASYTTDQPIPPTQADVYLLPDVTPLFTCNRCRGLHFIQDQGTGVTTVRFDDGPSGNAYSFVYGRGTLQLQGQFTTGRGSGTGTLHISDSMQPVVLASTMDRSSGVSWAFQGGVTFTQAFRAARSGIPRELGVRMGNNQNPYAVTMRILRNDAVILEKTFAGLTQRPGDWATVFGLGDVRTAVQAGDWIKFSMTPDQTVGIEPILVSHADWPQSDLAGYGKMAARFYMNGTLM